MSELHDQRLLGAGGRSGNWLQRALFIAIGTLFAVAAFFFLAIALAAGAFLALGIAVRWWWLVRRIRARAKASQALEGEYSVVDPHRVDSRPLDR